MTKSLLLVMPDGTERELLIGKLDGAYSLLCVDSPEDCPAILREKSFSLSAVLVDLRLTGNTGYCFSEALPDNGPFSRLPLIGVAPDVTDEPAGWALERGFSEIIEPTLPQALLLRRIQNVIRAADSMSFPELERLLRALPANIFLKDAQGRYVFSTQHWHHLYHAEDPNWSIRGLTDLEIRKDKDNALKAMESDREIVRSGEGVNYLLQEKADGLVEYLELIKRPVRDERGAVTGIVALINNVTEQQLLKMELEKRAQVDMLTELLNKVTTQELIDMRIDGCRRKKTMGTLMMIDVDNFKSVNDTYGHVIGDRVLAELGRVFRTSFRGTDVAGRVGGDEFMLFIPELATREAAEALARRIKDQVTKAFAGSPVEGKITISIGAALFPEHGQSFEELYRAADKALYTVKRNGKADFHFYTEA